MANPPPLPDPASQAPASNPVDMATWQWLFFRFDGRVGREVYWLSIILLTAVLGLSGFLTVDPETGMPAINSTFFTNAVYAAVTVTNIMVAIKRLHDLGMSGFFSIGLLMPVVGAVITVWLGIRKGDEGRNRYAYERDMPPRRAPPPAPANDD